MIPLQKCVVSGFFGANRMILSSCFRTVRIDENVEIFQSDDDDDSSIAPSGRTDMA